MGANETVQEKLENQKSAFYALKTIFEDTQEWEYLDDLRYWYLENNSQVISWRMRIAKGIQSAHRTLLDEDTLATVNKFIDTLNSRLESLTSAQDYLPYQRSRRAVESAYKTLKGRLEMAERTAYSEIPQSAELTAMRSELALANRQVEEWYVKDKESKGNQKAVQTAKAQAKAQEIAERFCLIPDGIIATDHGGWFSYERGFDLKSAQSFAEEIVRHFTQDYDLQKTLKWLADTYGQYIENQWDNLYDCVNDHLKDYDFSGLGQAIYDIERGLASANSSYENAVRNGQGEHPDNFAYGKSVAFPQIEIGSISHFVNREVGIPSEIAEELLAYARGSYQVTVSHADRINDLAEEYGTPKLGEVETNVSRRLVDKSSELITQAISACDKLVEAMNAFKKGGASNSTSGGGQLISDFKTQVMRLRTTLKKNVKGKTGYSVDAFEELENRFDELYEWVHSSFVQYGGTPNGETHLSKAKKAKFDAIKNAK